MVDFINKNMSKQITLSLELAKEMFNSNNVQLKKLALENFTEAELTKSFEEMFLDMWFGCTLHKDAEYPESVFLMKNGEWMFEQDFKNGRLYCRYNKVWKVFIDEFGHNFDQISDLIRGIVEQRFKLMGLTPFNYASLGR